MNPIERLIIRGDVNAAETVDQGDGPLHQLHLRFKQELPRLFEESPGQYVLLTGDRLLVGPDMEALQATVEPDAPFLIRLIEHLPVPEKIGDGPLAEARATFARALPDLLTRHRYSWAAVYESRILGISASRELLVAMFHPPTYEHVLFGFISAPAE